MHLVTLGGGGAPPLAAQAGATSWPEDFGNTRQADAPDTPSPAPDSGWDSTQRHTAISTASAALRVTNWPGSGPAALAQGIGRVHAVWLALHPQVADAQTLAWGKALRAHVWPGSRVYAAAPWHDSVRAQWQPLGWLPVADDPQALCFEPRWSVEAEPPPPLRHVTVIGAGLSGAACADELSRRGWQVDWLDQAQHPASGASGLPVGMLSPHRTARPTPMSELTEIGLPITLAHLRRLLPQGQGWAETWVDNLATERNGPPPGRDRAWLIAPGALVNAWWQAALDSALVRWRAQAHVARLRRIDDHWQVLDAQGQLLSESPHVVVASAFGARAILGDVMAHIRPVAGQMSWAQWPADQAPWAANPRRAHGVLTPWFATAHGPIWAVGSTYRRGSVDTSVQDSDHDANGQSLARLCPQALATFAQQRAQDQLQAFVGVRCASLDRMPLVGTVPQPQAQWPARGGLAAVARQPGLHVVTALGSRGLTLAAWAAQTLADQLEHQPLATPAHLVHACDPGRKGLLARA